MKKQIKELTVYSLLIAVILLFTFTPLGYLKIGVAEITFLCLPIIVGVFFGDVKAGLLLGTAFGISSLLTAFTGSAFGTMILSISPFGAAFLCVVPRIIMGLLCGLIYKKISSIEKIPKAAGYAILSLSAPILNTLLFVPTFLIIYGKSDYVIDMMKSMGTSTLVAFAIAAFAVNAACEAAFCLIVGAPLCKALEKAKIKK